ncbi:MAG: serine/threonine-protein kinase, partial [Myxococcota bacterium]
MSAKSATATTHQLAIGDEGDLAHADTAHAGATAADFEVAAARLPVVDRERYDMSSELGRGGIGKVTEARDRQLDRAVAVKELLEQPGAGRARFLREVLITARLQHPAIVPVYDAGFWSNGAPFYAMKLVSGKTLGALVTGAAGPAERLAYLPNLITVAEAIAYAHSRHIIHRDLKPSNVLVGEFGETVVVDWGLAKDLAEAETELDAVESVGDSGQLTRVGSIM